MALTVDSLRNLTGTGGITLDTQTGELAASALQKFKSYFNIGDARQKNTDTLIAIHHAIANDPNFAAPDVRAEAARLLGQIRTDRAISAAQVRTIVQTLDRLTQNTAEAVSSRVAARLAATMPPWAAGHERAVARFVTGNGQSTYATLSPADRTKANAFMAILMQKAETDLETGIPMALSRVPGNNAYNRIADFNLRPTRAFDISGSPAEGFTIHYLGRFYNARLDYTDEKGEPQMLEAPEKKTITSTYEMEIRISAASLDKVAAEDWSQYDETASKAILGEPGAHEDVLADHYAAIPQNFRLDCEVSAGFAIRVGARAPK
ncbi:MAG: hypothetical protein IJI36_12105 [Kiritimatiellae bacterium]|nr:hypothetical protein [Kiritimatiellia bacterium]